MWNVRRFHFFVKGQAMADEDTFEAVLDDIKAEAKRLFPDESYAEHHRRALEAYCSALEKARAIPV